jgi:hypothetical protein
MGLSVFKTVGTVADRLQNCPLRSEDLLSEMQLPEGIYNARCITFEFAIVAR